MILLNGDTADLITDEAIESDLRLREGGGSGGRRTAPPRQPAPVTPVPAPKPSGIVEPVQIAPTIGSPIEVFEPPPPREPETEAQIVDVPSLPETPEGGMSDEALSITAVEGPRVCTTCGGGVNPAVASPAQLVAKQERSRSLAGGGSGGGGGGSAPTGARATPGRAGLGTGGVILVIVGISGVVGLVAFLARKRS